MTTEIIKYEPTRDNVTKPNGSHGDETEVETIKEGPVLPESEEESTTAEEDAKEDKRASDSVKVVTEGHLVLLLLVPRQEVHHHHLVLLPISLPCPLPEYVVLDEDWLDVVLVVPGQLVDDGGEYLTNISDDRESERNPNNSKDDTKYPARQSDRGNVPIAYSGENSSAEEH